MTELPDGGVEAAGARAADAAHRQSRRVTRDAVGWLLGPELIAQLRKIVGRNRRDPRDWMAVFPGFVHDECCHCDGRLIGLGVTATPPQHADRRDGPQARHGPAPAAPAESPTRADASEVVAVEAAGAIRRATEALWAPEFDPGGAAATPAAPLTSTPPHLVRDAGAPHHAQASGNGLIDPLGGRPVESSSPEERNVVWFDYIADMGDSSAAMYAIAYACQTDLDLARPQGERRAGVDATGLPRTKTEASGCVVTPKVGGNLPRGQFLFVGGDAAYHIADEATLRSRVQAPFRWAREDLHRDGLLDESGPARRLYGIPGNHDWYDGLKGFSKLFRRSHDADAIVLPGFARVQLGSYVAIQLPHQWQLWGLDIDVGMDARQRRYFRSLLPAPAAPAMPAAPVDPAAPAAPATPAAPVGSAASATPGAPAAFGAPPRSRAPERLILCTPSPPIAFGAVTASKWHRSALRKLDLGEAHRGGPWGPPEGKKRLDLSGDIHHYARYAAMGERQRGPGGASVAGQDVADVARDYFAIVSGLGGAFHHPSFTRADRHSDALEPLVQYPTPADSLANIGPKLLHPWGTLVGSWLRNLPLAFALLLAFASRSSGGAGWLIAQFLGALRVGGRGLASASVGEGAPTWPAVLRVLRADEPAALDGWSELLRSTLLLGVVALVGGGLWGAVKRFGETYSEQTRDPTRKRNFYETKGLGWAPGHLLDPHRSYWLTTGVAVLPLLLAGLFLGSKRAPQMGSVWLDLGTLCVLLFAIGGGPYAAYAYGGKHLERRRKLGLVALGLVHGAALLVTPLLCALLSLANLRAALVAASLPFATGLMLIASRRAFARRQRWLVALLGVSAWLGGMAALIWAAGGERFAPATGIEALGGFFVGGLVAMCLTTMYFSWYLAVAGLADAHNNEVGGAARVTEFRQLIRFRLGQRGLTGYVFEVRDDNEGAPREGWPDRLRNAVLGRASSRPHGVRVKFALIDTFTIETPLAGEGGRRQDEEA
jgi:hypothetical protein